MGDKWHGEGRVDNDGQQAPVHLVQLGRLAEDGRREARGVRTVNLPRGSLICLNRLRYHDTTVLAPQ